MAEIKETKPTVNIRPKPGQTELNWREWLLLLGIIVVAMVICTYGGRAVVRSFAAAPATPTATPTRVRPTVTLVATPTPPAQPAATPTPNIPTNIDKGVYVTVVDAVNFRKDASTTAQIIRTLGAGEVLQVTDGPVSAGDRTWWKLKDPNGVEGWAAQDFLQPTAPPQ